MTKTLRRARAAIARHNAITRNKYAARLALNLAHYERLLARSGGTGFASASVRAEQSRLASELNLHVTWYATPT